MANPGVYPLDPSSDVGKVRLAIGDTLSVPLDPPVSGEESYTLFSDDEIDFFLDTSDGSLLRAAGYAYISLAGVAAQQAESISDYDLSIDSRQKATQLREQAKWYFAEADRIDASGEDAFTIVPTGADCSCGAELAANQWGYCGRCG